MSSPLIAPRSASWGLCDGVMSDAPIEPNPIGSDRRLADVGGPGGSRTGTARVGRRRTKPGIIAPAGASMTAVSIVTATTAIPAHRSWGMAWSGSSVRVDQAEPAGGDEQHDRQADGEPGNVLSSVLRDTSPFAVRARTLPALCAMQPIDLVVSPFACAQRRPCRSGVRAPRLSPARPRPSVDRAAPRRDLSHCSRRSTGRTVDLPAAQDGESHLLAHPMA